MNIEKKYFDDTCKMIREHWFPKHRVSLRQYNELGGQLQPIHELLYRQPDTSNYLVRYFLHLGTLFVSGDIGEATYRWSYEKDRTSLDWIAHCDFGYFASKLCGLNGAGHGKTWDHSILKQRLLASDAITGRLMDKARGLMGDRDEWNRFLWDEIGDIGYDLASQMSEWGLVPNSRVIGHWIGLRRAFGCDICVP